MQKALLILFGGRSMPNALTIIHERPDVIIALVSEDMQNAVPQLESFIARFFKDFAYHLDVSYTVKPFDVEDIQSKCIQAVKDYPGLDWIFNITSATALMSIGAYEAAKELLSKGESIRCWYLNTAQTTVVPVLGQGRDDKIFHIEVEQYAAVYDCRFLQGSLEEQKWLLLAHMLGKDSRYIDQLDIVLQAVGNDKPSSRSLAKSYVVAESADMYFFLKKAEEVNLLDNLQAMGGSISFRLSHLQFAFLDGAWLEVYVWNEAQKLELFSDCQWNLKVVDGKNFTEVDKDNRNQIDVALIYKAQLLVIECKTGERDALSSKTLDWMTAVVTPLGGRFVSKILVTSLPMPHKTNRSFELFKAKAESRSIFFVTREDLPDIGKLLEQQVKTPKYPRI